ncbi:MAG: redox-sensing transcriptional repressor Rex [Spirochaetaceae bacterium]|nr:MAG: redox-sensing transcriptional repressor Rex [Spirochaetaceae bacterium]
MNKQSIIRLSKYKNTLQRLKTLGFVKVFSDNLADALGIRATQVRKDFSQFQITGNKRGGYNIDDLLERILRILGKTNLQKVVLVGLGNMGTALMHYQGFEREGIQIVAGFDIDPAKIGDDGRIPVYAMDNLGDFITKNRIEVGVIAVPDIAAQRALDILVASGIKGVLNFAPIRLRAPEEVPVTNVNLVQEIENIFCLINAARAE